MMARRDGNGHPPFHPQRPDWSDRLSAVVAAVASLKVKSCLIDGEAGGGDDRPRS
jgi:hypothetical protein